eukprot:902042-Amphidinium_carterae.1
MGRSVKDPVAIPEERVRRSFREEARQKQEFHQYTSHIGKGVEEPLEEQSIPATPHTGEMPAPTYRAPTTAPGPEDIPGWDRLTNGNHMSGVQGINVMAAPAEWAQIADWYSDVLRTRHPRHFRPEDFLIVREELQRHHERGGGLADMYIARFEDLSEQQLARMWPGQFSLERKQNRALDYHNDLQLQLHVQESLFLVFDWDTACPWNTEVQFVDYAFRDLRRRQVFTHVHPDKLGSTPVVNCWPAEDLEDSAKFLTNEMCFLRTLREQLLKSAPPPARATPAGAASSSKAPPPDYTQPKAKPPPPQPGHDESAPP